MITLTDDDGAFAAQIAQAGKSRAKHRVSGDITESAFFVELLQSGFYRSNITQDTVFGQNRQNFAESVQRVFHRGSIDHQFRFELLDLLQSGEAVGVVYKPKLMRVDVEHGRLVLET